MLTTKSDADRLEEALSFGERYLSELDYEQAVYAYQVAIEIDPKCTDAYIGLAETGNLFVGRENGNGVTIIGYKNSLPEDVVIPEEINGLRVTEIAYDV